MVGKDEDLAEQLDRLLATPCQAWLLGAGTSVGAGIPLMRDLTFRVRQLIVAPEHKEIIDAIFEELPPSSNIEVLLSHLGDVVSLANRAKSAEVTIGSLKTTPEALKNVHLAIAQSIASTVMFGYQPPRMSLPEQIGTATAPIISVDGHLAFIAALFNTAQAGLQNRRGPIHLFTTNYDTLLEDSLSLSRVSFWDGFTGGAIAFRSFHFGDTEPSSGFRANLVKLHGSIDWHQDDQGRVWRVRQGDTYPKTNGRVLIYPQATKYVATQRDPFATQFDLLRRALASPSDNVLSICGYSFSDEHINQEIELAMSAPLSHTTLIVFYSEAAGWQDCLKAWQESPWGERIYILTEKGLYVGKRGPLLAPESGGDLDWWKFDGVVRLLVDGVGGVI